MTRRASLIPSKITTRSHPANRSPCSTTTAAAPRTLDDGTEAIDQATPSARRCCSSPREERRQGKFVRSYAQGQLPQLSHEQDPVRVAALDHPVAGIFRVHVAARISATEDKFGNSSATQRKRDESTEGT
jgi:hypothetical protein